MNDRRNLLLKISFFVLSMAFISCGKDWDDVSPYKLEIKGLDGNSITFEGKQMYKTIHINSNEKWSIKAESLSGDNIDWLQIKPNEGTGLNDEVTLEVTPNPNPNENLHAVMKIAIGTDKPKTIDVYNKIVNGKLEIDVKDNLLEYKNSLTRSIRLMSNAKWKVASKSDWLTMKENGAPSDTFQYVTVKCDDYIESDKIIRKSDLDSNCREGYIVIQLDGYPEKSPYRDTLVVKQVPTYYMGEGNRIECITVGEILSIESNIKWKVRAIDAEGLTISVDWKDGHKDIDGRDKKDECIARGDASISFSKNSFLNLDEGGKRPRLNFYCEEEDIFLKDFTIEIAY